jgi:hypothetical protein
MAADIIHLVFTLVGIKALRVQHDLMLLFPPCLIQKTSFECPLLTLSFFLHRGVYERDVHLCLSNNHLNIHHDVVEE